MASSITLICNNACSSAILANSTDCYTTDPYTDFVLLAVGVLGILLFLYGLWS